jgi:diguanylate cyclase (GGDEF)-like protein/putative nucleotidyltransferase with HDIG domain
MVRLPIPARIYPWGPLTVAGALVCSTLLHLRFPTHWEPLVGVLISAATLVLLAHRGAALSSQSAGWLQVERRALEQASGLHKATVEALAMAIEAKDSTSYAHLRHMQHMAGALARAVGMTEPEAQAVETAALLHDIGMLAVPPHIVAKTGKLSPEEFQKVRVHPRVGADIIRNVPFPLPVAPFIESHHERWDGTGYPASLRAQEIPLGARIIAIVDRFGALMTDRPHRLAKTRDEALDILRAEAGTGFDPVLVETFIGILPTLERELVVIVAAGEQAGASVAALADAAEPAEAATPRVLEDIALANREFYELYEMSQAMVTLSVADTMALIASRLTDLVPASACALFLEDDGFLRCRYASGLDADLVKQIAVPSGDTFIGTVHRLQRTAATRNPADVAPPVRGGRATSLKAALACPLVVGESSVGVLWVGHENEHAFESDHARVLDAIARQAATVLHNAILFERTRLEAVTDRLTGLLNSRGLATQFDQALVRAVREGEPLAVLMMDVDDLKTVNDTYGHAIGDTVLREVARTIRSVLRPSDLCARWSGDEFVAVVGNCGLADAERRALDVQATLSTRPIVIRPGEEWFARVSVGTAAFPQHARSLDGLMAAADERMYRDKHEHKQLRGSVSRSTGAPVVH